MLNFLKFLPQLLSTIVAIQTIAPTLKGQCKKQLLVDIIRIGTSIAATVPNNRVIQAGLVADSLVTALQTAGILVKDQVPPSGVN